MKAFVIKNKEGKYLCDFDFIDGINIFSENIINGIENGVSTYEDCQELLKEYDLKDCEVVEITIAEGNLEEENKQLKEQLAIKDRIIMLILKNTYYLDKEYFIEEIPTQDEYIVSQTKYWLEQAKESMK